MAETPVNEEESFEAARVWQALAGRLAGVPRMRLRTYDTRIGKHVYPRPDTTLSSLPPHVPAAVMLYDTALRCRALALDFDAGRLGSDAVTVDAESAIAFFRDLGATVVADVADSGGRHVWLPLQRPATVEQMRELTALCARLWPTLDTSPSNNPTDGCLTPPGSRCKDGRFRRLTVTFDEAITAVELRNSPDVLARAHAALRMLAPASATPPTTAATTAVAPALPHRFSLSARHQLIAIEGKVPADTSTRSGPWTRSHACFAVLCAAARRGLRLEDVEQQMDTGRWPGLTALYIGRYGARWRPSLRREWVKAQTVVSGPDRPQTVSTDPTLETHRTGGAPPTARLSHTAAERAFVLAWLDHAEDHVLTTMPGPVGHRVLAVIHALAYLAWRNRSRFVSAGTRSYAHAAAGCLDHTTVAETLHMLRTLHESQQLLRRVTPTNGRDADRYELLLPESARHPRTVNPTRTLRPLPAVFGVSHPDLPRRRLLGAIGWRLYRALCRGVTGTPLQVAQAAGVGRSSTYRLLAALATLGLAQQDEAGNWRLGLGDPYTAGSSTQNHDHLRRLHAGHQADRTAWRARLQQYIDNRPSPMPTPEMPESMWWPPPDDEPAPPRDHEPTVDDDRQATAMALLTAALSAGLDAAESPTAPTGPPTGIWLVHDARLRRYAEIRSLHQEEGMSVNQIAECLHISRQTVGRVLGIKRAGRDSKRPGPASRVGESEHPRHAR